MVKTTTRKERVSWLARKKENVFITGLAHSMEMPFLPYRSRYAEHWMMQADAIVGCD